MTGPTTGQPTAQQAANPAAGEGAPRASAKRGAADSEPTVILDPELRGSAQVHVGKPGLMPGERAPGRYAAPWADADTMLIPKSVLEPPGGLFGRIRAHIKRATITVLASLGLSSRQADLAARKLSTIVAVGAAALVVLLGLFADRLVMSAAEDQIEANAEADAQADPQAGTHSGVRPDVDNDLPGTTASVPHSRIRSNPPEAEVLAHGQVVGRTPLSVAKSTSPTLLLVRRDGYEPQMVQVGPDSPDEFTIELRPIEPGAPSVKPSP